MDSKITEQIELLFGSVGVILGVFFSVFLLFSYKKQPKSSFFLALYLLTFSLRIGKSVFHYFYVIEPAVRNLFLATLFCVGPSLWLYTKHLTKPNTNIGYGDFIHYFPFVLILPFCTLIPNNGPNEYSYIFAIFYNAIIAHMFAYVIGTIVWFMKHKEKNPIGESKKRTIWVKYFLAINLSFVILYFLISQLVFPFYIGLSFLFSCVVIFFSVWALKNPFLFKTFIEKYNNSTLDEKEVTKLIMKLKALMETDKPYLDPSLTLSKLSLSLEVSSKELSRVINQMEGLNYSQFVSKYRILEVKRLINSTSHSKFTIAAIAYDSGFNSISSFNAAFKKHTKKTAIEYRKSIKGR